MQWCYQTLLHNTKKKAKNSNKIIKNNRPQKQKQLWQKNVPLVLLQGRGFGAIAQTLRELSQNSVTVPRYTGISRFPSRTVPLQYGLGRAWFLYKRKPPESRVGEHLIREFDQLLSHVGIISVWKLPKLKRLFNHSHWLFTVLLEQIHVVTGLDYWGRDTFCSFTFAVWCAQQNWFNSPVNC